MKQFGHFDGLDNRKTLMQLFVRLGSGLPEAQAREKRATFLRSLIDRDVKQMFQAAQIKPCSAVEGYHLFVALTGVLGVNIDAAARKLERLVRNQ